LGRDDEIRMIARHRRAKYDYAINDTFEAGLVLTGTEVKSLRDGQATIAEAFVQIKDGEAWLLGCHIPEYRYGNRFNHEPRRPRKLLLKRSQIDRIDMKIAQGGFTGVPMELYFSKGYAKLLFGLGKGKKNYDKRQDEKKKIDRREMKEQY